MTERVEECQNNWPDGTCPQCGETHYVIVRRSVLAQAEREIERTNDAYEASMRRMNAAEAALARVRKAATEYLTAMEALALEDSGGLGGNTQEDFDRANRAADALRAALEGR